MLDTDHEYHCDSSLEIYPVVEAIVSDKYVEVRLGIPMDVDALASVLDVDLLVKAGVVLDGLESSDEVVEVLNELP